ncbi:MAG: N-acetylglucosamine-6-phosphate deacetylase [Planctomycetota bacterium]|nr:N-acetylglucosamine-6-phosphate deacetylase [Planctomycetota bacterium]
MSNYFDLQVNGYGGIDFNREGLTADELHTACEYLQRDGVAGILATIVTEHLPQMEGRLRRLVELRERDPLAQKLISGLHIEGPFINPEKGYRGAHPEDAIVPAELGAMRGLLEAAGGLTRVVTLAPELDANFAVTHYLAEQGIVVSAGHCGPSLEVLRDSIDAGLSMFTHLGNGCPMMCNRHDNIVQRVLSLSDRLWICFIADGAHIPWPALKNYIRLVGPERAIVVTDAIAPAGLGPGNYTVARWKLTIGEDLIARAPDGSHLVGAAMNMPRVERNLCEHLGLSVEQVYQLTSVNPRRALRMLP